MKTKLLKIIMGTQLLKVNNSIGQCPLVMDEVVNVSTNNDYQNRQIKQLKKSNRHRPNEI